MTNKYTSIVSSIYKLGIGISITYEIRNRNIMLDKAIKNGKEVKDNEYIISSFNGLINGAILGLFLPITIIGHVSVKLTPEDKIK
jgi:hypothetical protein